MQSSVRPTTTVNTNALHVSTPSINVVPLTAPVNPTPASMPPYKRSPRGRVLFYDKNKPYYEFTNFSPHPVEYNGKRFPTSEHLFQSFKFIDAHPEIAEYIRTCGDRPMAAFDEAHRYQSWVRPDWRQVNIVKMEEALRLKFTQHKRLRQLLLDTGDDELIEDSPRDYFWGVGADYSGRNELGKALERLRDELRHENNPKYFLQPHGKRDMHRLSLQDIPSLLSPMSAAGHVSNFIRTVSNSASSTPQSPISAVSASSKTMCEFCQQKPKFQRHRYCSRNCAQAAKMCIHCRTKPKFDKHPYCSKTCAADYVKT
ncbi:DUF1768-domain-containing protein [Coniophora puteana RWD-64-598 SS2]|uniref:DUF1768-domain-containing protein n=1 Tax=Coniophora puteana (strain RWD-64-598) TaxID=741705 RepID=A0A5M3MZ42_CONPW|nr:DUF1768-domain-containing protein [Coniophora puteana RWD-64-598 SS2]EIW84412.1 DUF1768-domain-containing protein [Coniophora puteana RWD-64-598 SS2]